MTKRRFRIGNIENKWLRRAALVVVAPLYVITMIPAFLFDVFMAAGDVFRETIEEGRKFAITLKQSWRA